MEQTAQTCDSVAAGSGEVGDTLAGTPVPGDKAGPVVEGYVAARERLFNSYEDNLEQIRA